ncbi:hypothetical protein GmHk_18G050457 [Glycine max]|nr:hypothetical protein GmHk_18G050457 [Glycine max]
MPNLSLCEDIRTYIMRKMTSVELKMAARLGPLVSDPDGTRLEIYHYETRLDVDLQSQSCICRIWKLTSIPLSLPCRHVIAAIRYNNHKPKDYNMETIFILPSMLTAFRLAPVRPPTPIRIIFPDKASYNKNQPNYTSFILIPRLPSHRDSKK